MKNEIEKFESELCHCQMGFYTLFYTNVYQPNTPSWNLTTIPVFKLKNVEDSFEGTDNIDRFKSIYKKSITELSDSDCQFLKEMEYV